MTEEPITPLQTGASHESSVQESSISESEQSVAQTELPKKRVPVGWFVVVGIVIVLAVLFYFFRSVFVAAIVDGKPISRYVVARQLEERMGAEVLDALINEVIIEQRAADAGITISAEDVAREITVLEENLSAQGATLASALAAQGITQEDLETDIRFRLLAEQLLSSRINISDEEVEAYKAENAEFLPKDIPQEVLSQNIRDALFQQKFSTAFQEWLIAARSEANVSYWKDY